MKGEILSANLSNGTNTGTNTITVANAPFRVYHQNGTAGAPPALPDNAHASLHSTTGTFELPAGRHFILPHDTGNRSAAVSASTRTGSGHTSVMRQSRIRILSIVI